jgi:cytochrome P450
VATATHVTGSAELVEVPGALPGVGHALQLARRPLEFLRRAHAYGDVVVIRLGRAKAYFVNQPEALRTLLIREAGSFDKGIHYEKARVSIGNGLAASEGEFHRRQRKLIRPAFQRARIRGYFDVMKQSTLDRMATWPAQGPDLHAELHALTATIAGRALFSTEFAMATVDDLEQLVDTVAAGVQRRITDPTGLLEKLPLPSIRRFEQALKRMNDSFDAVIREYRGGAGNGADILSLLLAARDETDGEGMSDQQVRDEVCTLLLGGLETTAQVLKWTCYVLGEHPEVQQRVREEVDAVTGGRELDHDHLERLDYTRRMLKEVLRRYPPLYFLSRRPVVDVEVAGHVLPAGSTVLFSPYALQHDPALYPDPERFDPDRWLPGGPAEGLPQISFAAFGAGIRSCIGDHFAMIEMLTVVGCLLQRWTVRRIPSVVVRPKATFVLAPGVPGVELVPRA